MAGGIEMGATLSHNRPNHPTESDPTTPPLMVTTKESKDASALSDNEEHTCAERTSPQKKRPLTLHELPMEMKDQIFSHLQEDLHVTPRASPANDDNYNLVAINSAAWRSLLVLKRVSREFRVLIRRSIDIAGDTGSIQLVMNTKDTLHKTFVASDVSDTFVILPTPVGMKVNIVPDSVLHSFTSIRVSSVFVAVGPLPDRTASVKRLTAIVRRASWDKQFRLVSTCWTEPSRSPQHLNLQLPCLEWKTELNFAPAFDLITQKIRDRCFYNEDEGSLGDFKHLNSQRVAAYHQVFTESAGTLLDLGTGAQSINAAASLYFNSFLQESLGVHRIHTKKLTMVHRSTLTASNKTTPGDDGVSFLTKWRMCMAEMETLPKWKSVVDGVFTEA